MKQAAGLTQPVFLYPNLLGFTLRSFSQPLAEATIMPIAIFRNRHKNNK